MCGAKITPINPLYTVGELSVILERSSSKILVTHANLLPVAMEAASKCKCVEHVVVIPHVESDPNIPSGTVRFERLVEYEHYPPLDHSVNEVHKHVNDVDSHPWLLPYSSGTTGEKIYVF